MAQGNRSLPETRHCAPTRRTWRGRDPVKPFDVIENRWQFGTVDKPVQAGSPDRFKSAFSTVR